MIISGQCGGVWPPPSAEQGSAAARPQLTYRPDQTIICATELARNPYLDYTCRSVNQTQEVAISPGRTTACIAMSSATRGYPGADRIEHVRMCPTASTGQQWAH